MARLPSSESWTIRSPRFDIPQEESAGISGSWHEILPRNPGQSAVQDSTSRKKNPQVSPAHGTRSFLGILDNPQSKIRHPARRIRRYLRLMARLPFLPLAFGIQLLSVNIPM